MACPWCFRDGFMGVQCWVHGGFMVGSWCFRTVPVVAFVVSTQFLHGVSMVVRGASVMSVRWCPWCRGGSMVGPWCLRGVPWCVHGASVVGR